MNSAVGGRALSQLASAGHQATTGLVAQLKGVPSGAASTSTARNTTARAAGLASSVGGLNERQGLPWCGSAAQQTGHAQVFIEAQGRRYRAPVGQLHHQLVVRAAHVSDAIARVSHGTLAMP